MEERVGGQANQRRPDDDDRPGVSAAGACGVSVCCRWLIDFP